MPRCSYPYRAVSASSECSPGPVVDGAVHFEGANASVSVLLDSGADYSDIREDTVAALDAGSNSPVPAYLAQVIDDAGRATVRPFVLLDVRFARCKRPISPRFGFRPRKCEDPEGTRLDDVVLGRDGLDRLVVVLDGPGQRVSIEMP